MGDERIVAFDGPDHWRTALNSYEFEITVIARGSFAGLLTLERLSCECHVVVTPETDRLQGYCSFQGLTQDFSVLSKR